MSQRNRDIQLLMSLLNAGAAVKANIIMSFDIPAIATEDKPEKKKKKKSLAPVAAPSLPLRKKRPKKYARQLSHNQVWDIRDYIKIGKSNRWIQKKLGLKNTSTVNRIRHNQSYTRVGDRPHSSTTNADKPTTVHAGHGVVTND